MHVKVLLTIVNDGMTGALNKHSSSVVTKNVGQLEMNYSTPACSEIKQHIDFIQTTPYVLLCKINNVFISSILRVCSDNKLQIY